MQVVTDWGQSVIVGVTTALQRLFGALPNILGALIVLVIGWIIAGMIGKLVARVLQMLRVDLVGDRIGVNGFLQQSGTKMRVSGILGELVAWTIRLIFIEMAAEQLGMPQVTQIINNILAFIPNIIVAAVVLGVGAFLGQVLAGIVRGAAAESQIGSPNLLARLTYGAVMAFAIIAALNQLGVAPVVVDTLYIGLVAAISLALGLAFGLGGRETAARYTERWAQQLEQGVSRATTASLSDPGTRAVRSDSSTTSSLTRARINP